MNYPSHISGGIVFTGVWVSLWNVNVFSSITMLSFTIFASLLPDIDHTRSPIGKIFFPLAKFIDRRFGHRTITHSLLFIIIATLSSLFVEHYFSNNFHYTLILFFALLSHNLLDMITIQGVPFFYPFFKNPCVIPASPQYRLNSNSSVAELSVFIISLLLLISCINLFEHGFWTSYRRAFASIKHVHREHIDSEKFLIVDYNFSKNNVSYSGAGYLVNSSDNSITLFCPVNNIIQLNSDDITTNVFSVRPSKSPFDKNYLRKDFFNISYDSLISLTSNKVVTGTIQSSKPVEVIQNNISKRTSLLNLNNTYNFSLSVVTDTLSVSLRRRLDILKMRLERDERSHDQNLSKLSNLQIKYNKLRDSISATTDIYSKNIYQNKAINIRNQIDNLKPKIYNYEPDPFILYEIRYTENLLHDEGLYFSGSITYPDIPLNDTKTFKASIFN